MLEIKVTGCVQVKEKMGKCQDFPFEASALAELKTTLRSPLCLRLRVSESSYALAVYLADLSE